MEADLVDDEVFALPPLCGHGLPLGELDAGGDDGRPRPDPREGVERRAADLRRERSCVMFSVGAGTVWAQLSWHQIAPG